MIPNCTCVLLLVLVHKSEVQVTRKSNEYSVDIRISLYSYMDYGFDDIDAPLKLASLIGSVVFPHKKRKMI